jgi:hypothetical protein
MGLYYNKGGEERVGRPNVTVVEDEPATDRPLREDAPRSARTTVRRRAGRARYDSETIDAILDTGLVGHVAFTSGGQPYAMPMLYARRSRVGRRASVAVDAGSAQAGRALRRCGPRLCRAL